MSGGTWNYCGPNLKHDLQLIADDVASRWPTIAEILSNLGDVLEKAEHDMDWCLAGDTIVENDPQFDSMVAGAILDTVLKASPDRFFERGKWATIQAFQANSDSHQYLEPMR